MQQKCGIGGIMMQDGDVVKLRSCCTGRRAASSFLCGQAGKDIQEQGECPGTSPSACPPKTASHRALASAAFTDSVRCAV